MDRLKLIKQNLENSDEHMLNISKSDIEWLISKFEELEKYTLKTRERWIEVHKKNIELEKQLGKINE